MKLAQEPVREAFKSNRPSRTHGWIEAEDEARIYVRVQGEGEPLLAMGGIGSGAFTTAGIADLLAERYKLISYDRRGTFRSSTSQPHSFDISQQCRDVQRICEAHELTSVTVLATCSASSIALELLANHSELVSAMVIHDPMSVTVLPDAEAETDKLLAYDRLYWEHGPDLAMSTFLADFELPYPDDFRRAIKREGHHIVPEMKPCVIYEPDIERLRPHRNRLIMAAGRQCMDRNYAFARAAQALSEQVGCPFTVVPGNHTGYFQEPVIFADAILSLIEGFSAN